MKPFQFTKSPTFLLLSFSHYLLLLTLIPSKNTSLTPIIWSFYPDPLSPAHPQPPPIDTYNFHPINPFYPINSTTFSSPTLFPPFLIIFPSCPSQKRLWNPILTFLSHPAHLPPPDKFSLPPNRHSLSLISPPPLSTSFLINSNNIFWHLWPFLPSSIRHHPPFIPPPRLSSKPKISVPFLFSIKHVLTLFLSN